MSSRRAAPITQDHLDYQVQGLIDCNDETKFESKLRETREAWEAEMREKLDAVRSRRRVYREIALRTHRLSDERFRILCYFLEKADTDLDNVFPKRETVAAVLGISVNAYEQRVTWLCAHGWIRTHKFRRSDGKRSSSGIQLGVPFVSGAWWGPAVFSKRHQAIRIASSPSPDK